MIRSKTPHAPRSRGVHGATHAVACIALCAGALSATVASASRSSPAPAPAQDPSGATVARGLDRWTERLERLVPTNPLAYFELAEEVDDSAGTTAERSLARELYARAGALAPDRLGRSAALALAALEPTQNRRERFRALAFALGGFDANTPRVDDETARAQVTAVELGSVFSALRRGDGRAGLRALRDPEVERLLAELEPLVPGGSERLRRELELRSGRREPFAPSEVVLAAQLGLEAAALSVVADRTFAESLDLSGSAPLIEVDPARLDEAFEVDRDLPYWREGGWRATP